MNSFRIEVDGVRYQGSWLLQGDILLVRSDYGSTSVPLGELDPPTAARKVLRQLAHIDEPTTRSS